MEIKSVRGTKDILPDEIEKWQNIEHISRQIFSLYGFKEIRTPIIENANLFKRSIGETTDIVEKEMYTFQDIKARTISLRPEATASIVRAYIENNLDKKEGFVKLYYIGPMFRAERPQKGRQRQFHQLGVEAIGSYSPFLDTEIILLLNRLLKNLSITNFVLKINSLGCSEDRKNFTVVLKENLKKHLKGLCEDCNSRFNRNVLRILDCKKESCKKIVRTMPKITDNLCKECVSHFNLFKDMLKEHSVNFTEDKTLVRGLDYYTKTVFEVIHPLLGAQDAIGAGGRYDNLIELFGGPRIGAIGFALGIERLFLACDLDKITYKDTKPCIYFASIGEPCYREAFSLAEKLRSNGVRAEVDYEGKSLKAQMKEADKLNVSTVAILGEDELKKGEIILRDMKTSSQKSIKIEKLLDAILLA
ncbi:MAG: histidine--tRNA ligase [Candidatus Omnitrophica bacterium]|nr:histidine--tRNA ligase [Candidatus Omnitrophota bacterium]